MVPVQIISLTWCLSSFEAPISIYFSEPVSFWTLSSENSAKSTARAFFGLNQKRVDRPVPIDKTPQNLNYVFNDFREVSLLYRLNVTFVSQSTKFVAMSVWRNIKEPLPTSVSMCFQLCQKCKRLAFGNLSSVVLWAGTSTALRIWS